IVRFASEDKSLIGQFVQVRITSAAPFSTEGELVKVIDYISEINT
ncbi:MAG: hypothetical protein DRI72_06425, partial [Bacteroidetes bacterium]